MVVEIPKGTSAKMEISVNSDFNPIVQDYKNGKPRFIPDVNGHKGYPVNYGAIPQVIRYFIFLFYCSNAIELCYNFLF